MTWPLNPGPGGSAQSSGGRAHLNAGDRMKIDNGQMAENKGIILDV